MTEFSYFSPEQLNVCAYNSSALLLFRCIWFQLKINLQLFWHPYKFPSEWRNFRLKPFLSALPMIYDARDFLLGKKMEQKIKFAEKPSKIWMHQRTGTYTKHYCVYVKKIVICLTKSRFCIFIAINSFAQIFLHCSKWLVANKYPVWCNILS